MASAVCTTRHCSPYDTEDIDGMKEHLQAIVTALSLVNPFVCGASGGGTYFYRS